MKKTMAGLVVLTASLMLVAITVQADTKTENFEGFALGSPDGQGGWVFTGPYDVEIVNPDTEFGVTDMGSRALRISNAVTSGSFGDWVFSQELNNPAGESGEPHFEATLRVESALTTLQPGLQFSYAPQSNGGDRMSFIRFEDESDGVHVFFADVTGTSSPVTFNTTDIATLSRARHTVRIEMDFVAGPSNDVVKVFIDGTLRITGTSWENYFRFDAEAQGWRDTHAEVSPLVDSLIFQARDGAGTAPDTLDEGFLVDGVSLVSGTVSGGGVPTPTPTPTPPPTVGPCTLVGTSGPDVLIGTMGDDTICARGGDDIIRGKGGNDIIKAGPGADLVRGGAGDDSLFGGPGRDRLNGGSGFDTCRGGGGKDVIRNCES